MDGLTDGLKVKRLVDCRIYEKETLEFFIINSAHYQPFNFLCCFIVPTQHPIFISLTDGPTDGLIDGFMDGRTDRYTLERTHGQMDGLID